ncbi:MAG TPA: FCD domain-containing protein [Jatrophihabitantaceae bacterium]|jgi:GntR family transcriptional repressor for pyruvate dehydrogenase complex
MNARGVVLRHVEDELAAGRLHVGDRLPGERALGTQLGISRPSVREGIRVLEAMGVIRTAAGSGPDAGAVVVADTSAGITSALRLHLASSTLPVADVVRTRVLLETWSVREASRRRDPEQLAEARTLLDAMDADLTVEDFLLLDAEFHVTLCRAAGNAVVAAIMTSLRDAIHGYVLAAAPPDWAPMARRLRRQHRNVLDAVRAGDGERAARLVARHIERYYRANPM